MQVGEDRTVCRDRSGELVVRDIEVLQCAAFPEIGRYPSRQEIMGEINGCDCRERRDFPRDDSCERIPAEVQHQELLTVPNVPRLGDRHIFSGKGVLKEFSETFKYWSAKELLRSAGISPENLLLLKSRKVRLGRTPNPDGIVPFRWLA